VEETAVKLTHASRYAVRALVAIAASDGAGAPVASHRTGRAEGIPEWFRLRVLKALVNAGVLHSVRGPHGGYRLAKPPAQITLLEVVEAVDGPVRGGISFSPGQESGPLDRRLNEVCQRVAEQTRRRLGKVRLSDLVGPGGNKLR
jgi:Rrf2 family protein